MQYLLDTVTIIRHFSGSGKIGIDAQKIIKNNTSEHGFYISVISLMEILYLAEKNRIPLNLNDTLKNINKSTLYTVLDLTPEILKIAQTIQFNELHDRLILATAKWIGVPVISSDKRFHEIKDVRVIW